MKGSRKAHLKSAGRVVIKVGTGVLTASGRSLDTRVIQGLVRGIKRLKEERRQVVLVSSGAIGAGMGLLNKDRRPEALADLQACAAVGQGELIHLYNTYFRRRGYLAAQVLLTQDDLHHRGRYLNARNTLMRLLAMNIVPIVNENDTVAVDELKFGDNDLLAGQVAGLVEADLVIILTNVDGLVHHGTGGVLSVVEEITPQLERELIRDEPGQGPGTGGMRSKLKAVRMVTQSGVPAVIANGRDPAVLRKIFTGREAGTLFLAKGTRLSARKRWLGFSMRPGGDVVVDDGACRALTEGGRSLLASGVRAVSGHFGVGDLIRVKDLKGHEFARGLANHTRAQVERIRGMSSAQIRSVLGEGHGPEVIHRDNLVLL
ncbi:MAG: glutamate 5-kinase [Candidatus Omnitrophica bacterium]|nr:glutamate 5-kinase [Candidatus Omnitrophota bacterium]